MKVNEAALTKGELRKLTALRKSVGPKLGDEVFKKWFQQRPDKATVQLDSMAVKIEELFAPYARDKNFKLGTYGYNIRRSKGKGAKGFVVVKNLRP